MSAVVACTVAANLSENPTSAHKNSGAISGKEIKIQPTSSTPIPIQSIEKSAATTLTKQTITVESPTLKQTLVKLPAENTKTDNKQLQSKSWQKPLKAIGIIATAVLFTYIFFNRDRLGSVPYNHQSPSQHMIQTNNTPPSEHSTLSLKHSPAPLSNIYEHKALNEPYFDWAKAFQHVRKWILKMPIPRTINYSPAPLSKIYEHKALNSETAIQSAESTHNIVSESLKLGGDHSQNLFVPSIISDYGSKDYIITPPSTANFRLNETVLSTILLPLNQLAIATSPPEVKGLNVHSILAHAAGIFGITSIFILTIRKAYLMARKHALQSMTAEVKKINHQENGRIYFSNFYKPKLKGGLLIFSVPSTYYDKEKKKWYDIVIDLSTKTLKNIRNNHVKFNNIDLIIHKKEVKEKIKHLTDLIS